MWTKLVPVWLLKLSPPPPKKKLPADVKKITLWHILIHCAYISSVMRPTWHFGTPGSNIWFPRTSQKWKQQICILWILTQKSLSDYFHIWHVGERISEKQDGSTKIIEAPPPCFASNSFIGVMLILY